MPTIRTVKSLDLFFNPKSIAVVGASNRVNSPGYVIVKQLLKKYRGKIYPVNPKYEEVLGLHCYHSLREVPEKPDLVVLAIPAKAVPQALEEAAAIGARAAIIISGGFAEVGGEGAKLQQEVENIIVKYGIRVIGPNCIGVLDNTTGVDTFFLPEERLPRPQKGSVSIVSQSGALLSMWMDWLAQIGLGVAKAVSYGNKVDVDDADVISYLAEDSNTRIILLYLEGLKKGRGKAFMEAVKKALCRGKPVIVLKGGKTGRGSMAAASHTAALATGYEIYRSVFKQTGVLEVSTMEEMFDIAKAYTMMGVARGRRLLVLTNAGGEGVLATDYATQLGLEVPLLPEHIRSKLRKALPPFVVVNNPVDLTADTSDEEYKLVLETILPENIVDVAVVIAPPHPPGMSGKVADYMHEAHQKYGIPIIAVATGGKLADAFMELFESRGIPAYPTPERAVRVAAALANIGEYLRRAKCS